MIKRISIFRTDFLDKTEKKALIYMVFGGFSFATMGTLTHGLGQHIDWILIVVIRMFTTFLITSAAAMKSGINPFLLTHPLLWFRSFVGSGAMLATFYALTNLPVSDVSAITETRPIWVAIFAGLILGESTGRRIWISITLGIAGVILIEKPHILDRNYAALVALLASLLGAIVMICLRKLRDLDPRVIVTHFSATATIVALCLLLLYRGTPDFESLYCTKIIIMLAGVGIFGTFGQLAMTKAFSLGKAPTVSTAGLTKVGIAAIYDIFIWKYVFQLTTVAGMVLILFSTAWLFAAKSVRLGKLKED